MKTIKKKIKKIKSANIFVIINLNLISLKNCALNEQFLLLAQKKILLM